MDAYTELKLARKEIGTRLSSLRWGEESPATREMEKDKLSLALKLQSRILRENPHLQTPKQMRLL